MVERVLSERSSLDEHVLQDPAVVWTKALKGDVSATAETPDVALPQSRSLGFDVSSSGRPRERARGNGPLENGEEPRPERSRAILLMEPFERTQARILISILCLPGGEKTFQTRERTRALIADMTAQELGLVFRGLAYVTPSLAHGYS